MKIQVIGVGVVGTVTADGFRRFGHDLTLMDVDEEKVAKLKEEDWDVHTDLRDAEVHFICVPEGHVEDAVRDMRAISGLIVVRSSVEPETCVKLSKKYRRDVCSNPEFLTAATALRDFLNPDKIVIGECCREHGDLLESLYEPFRSLIVRVNPTTAEMVKMASNAYLATQISFWNSIHEMCEKSGVNSHEVGKICALDHRITSYGASQHGRAYGGFCLPKDLANLVRYSKSVGYDPVLLNAVKEVNDNA